MTKSGRIYTPGELFDLSATEKKAVQDELSALLVLLIKSTDTKEIYKALRSVECKAYRTMLLMRLGPDDSIQPTGTKRRKKK